MNANKHCAQCGASLGGRMVSFCSASCSNKSRSDHTPETAMARFWKKVDKTAGFGPNGDCWRWTGRVEGHGYGEMKIAGRYKKAHRIALFGPIDIDNPLFACHTCDNRLCVKPDHLFAGQSIDNVRDMHRKGRSTVGTRARRLTRDQVIMIRGSGKTSYELGKRLGIDPTAISQARKRATYKDIP